MNFREIEKNKGITVVLQDKSSLSKWYSRMRDVPLSAFGIGDLCRSIRQTLYLEWIVPIALEVLEKEPLAGDMYDGELAIAFHSIPEGFWRENSALSQRLLRALKVAHGYLDDNQKTKVDRVITEIDCLIKGVVPVVPPENSIPEKNESKRGE